VETGSSSIFLPLCMCGNEVTFRVLHTIELLRKRDGKINESRRLAGLQAGLELAPDERH